MVLGVLEAEADDEQAGDGAELAVRGGEEQCGGEAGGGRRQACCQDVVQSEAEEQFFSDWRKKYCGDSRKNNEKRIVRGHKLSDDFLDVHAYIE